MRTLILLSVLIIVAGCNAPKNNPLDPENPDNRIYTITGTVKGKALPYPPIEGVMVTWENTGKFVVTDEKGEFSFTELSAKDGKISFKKDGFQDSDTFLVWQNSKNYNLDALLDKVPVLDSLEFFSIVENKSQFSNPKYSLSVRARIIDSDGDNDIDTVWIYNEELGFKALLFENSTTQFYERVFKITDLNLLSLQEIIGKKFSILVKSLDDDIYEVGSTNLTRVISQVLQTIAPQNNLVVMENPFDLEWNRFTPGFNFTYFIQIKTDESQPELVWERRGISKDDISLTVEFQFNPGDYFWVIWCEDEFKNRGSSYNATFTIPEKTTKNR